MEYRKLGNTGYDVGTVGFGMWQVAGGRWLAPAPKDAVRLLVRAHELGVNVFDAAVVYGQYLDSAGRLGCRAQELLADAFGSCREEVIYCVKVGQYDEISHRADFGPARIVQHVRESLQRLRTSYLDICLIHAPSLHEVRSGRALAVLQALQALGTVRAIGYSFENEPDHASAALDQPVDVIMLQLNLIDRQCAAVIEQARIRGIGILAGGPFKRGYLSGRFRTLGDIPREDDYWRWNLDKNPRKVASLLAATEELRCRYGDGPALRRAALGFVLGNSGVASAIVGHRSLQEVEENMDHVRTFAGAGQGAVAAALVPAPCGSADAELQVTYAAH